MTSRSPEWISVGNLGDGKAQSVCSLQGLRGAEPTRLWPSLEAHPVPAPTTPYTQPTEVAELQRGWATSAHPPLPHQVPASPRDRKGTISWGGRNLPAQHPAQSSPAISSLGSPVLTRP